MDFSFDTVLDIASAATSIAFPALAPVIGAVNALVGDSDPVPENATGADVRQRIDRLPPDQRASLLAMQIDAKKCEIVAKKDMYVSDNITKVEMFKILSETNGQTTRPEVVRKFASDIRVVTWLSLFALLLMIYLTDGKPDWTALGALGAFTASILTTQNLVIRKYFDALESEQRNVIEGSTGSQLTSGMPGVAAAATGSIVGRIKSAVSG